MRNVKQLPAIFQEVLGEFKFRSSAFNAQEITNLNEEQKKALYYICLDKFISTLSEDLFSLGNTLLDKNASDSTFDIMLPPYGIKLRYDTEANWFVTEEMSDKDWQDYDKKCNELFLAKK